MISFAAAALAASLVAPAGAASALRPLTVEDLWAVPRVGAPALSPDGALAVVPVTVFSMDENKGNSDLWLVRIDGGAPPRRLTSNEGADGSPVWSPDGTRIAFVSKRGEGPSQLYVLPLAGGEAEKITDLPVGVEDPKWFPDGKRIGFLAATWPDLGGDFAAVKSRLDEREKDKVKAYASENRLVRYWDHWLTDGKFPHVFAVDLATRAVTDLTPGSARLMGLMESGGGWDISPDGAEIAFAANATAPPYATMNYDVFVVSSAGGETHDLTADNPADDVRPRYSPDGRFLLYGRQTRVDVDPEFMKLMRRDRQTGTVVPLTRDWDFNAEDWSFTPDAATVLVHAERRGRVHLWTVPVSGGAPAVAVEGGTIGGSAAGPAGIVVYSRQTLLAPPEIYAARLGSPEERRLTTFTHDALEGVDLGSFEDVRFRGAADDEVQMFVVYPPGFTPARTWPLLQVLHGGPHGSWTDSWHARWNAALFASKGYVTVLLNFHGSMGEGQAFAESILGAHGDKPFEDVMKSTDALVARKFVDDTRLAVAGGSYGGYLTAWVVSKTPRFKAAVVHAGVYDLLTQMGSDVSYGRLTSYGGTPWEGVERIERWSPSRFAKGLTTPTLVVHGEKDYRVPITQGLALYGTLQAKGVPARLLVFPEENHWVLKPQAARLWWREVFGWLDRWVGADAASPR